jgi:hypothetical protein
MSLSRAGRDDGRDPGSHGRRHVVLQSGGDGALNGHYIGCDPGTGPLWPVYVFGQNGDTRSGPAGEWETLELTLRPGSTTQFSTLFVTADRQLTAVPASPGVPAHLETRVDGAIGLWETESAVTEPTVSVSGIGMRMARSSMTSC